MEAGHADLRQRAQGPHPAQEVEQPRVVDLVPLAPQGRRRLGRQVLAGVVLLHRRGVALDLVARDAVVLLREVAPVGDLARLVGRALHGDRVGHQPVAVGDHERHDRVNLVPAQVEGRHFQLVVRPAEFLGRGVALALGGRFGLELALAPVVDAGVVQLLGDPVLAAVADVRPGDVRRAFDERTTTDSAELHGSFVPWKTQTSSLALTASFATTDAFSRSHDCPQPPQSWTVASRVSQPTMSESQSP